MHAKLSRIVFLVIALSLSPASPSIAAIVFSDNFDGNVVAPRYTPLGASSLSQSGGFLHSTFNNVGDGVNINLSDLNAGVCTDLAFAGRGIADGVGADIGYFMRRLDTGEIYQFADVNFIKVGSQTNTRVKITILSTLGFKLTQTLTVPGDWSNGTQFRLDCVDPTGNPVDSYLVLEAKDFIFFHTELSLKDIIPGMFNYCQNQVPFAVSVRKSQGGDDSELLLDSIVIDSTHVPEPSSLLLCGLGVIGVAVVTRYDRPCRNRS